jgi:hypothetical protein
LSASSRTRTKSHAASSLRVGTNFRELSRAVQTRQFFGIAPIRLHAIAGSTRHQRRRNHDGAMPQVRDLSLHFVAARTRFINKGGRASLGQPLDQARNGFRIILNR